MQKLSFLICAVFQLNLYCQNQYSNPQWQPYQSTYVPRPYEATKQMYEYQSQQQQKQIDAMKMDAQKCVNLTKEYYYSIQNYPEVISNGEHNVTAIDEGNYFCAIRKVKIEDGKISAYYNGSGASLTIIFASRITKGKATIRVIYSDGTESGYIELYFIEDILR